MVEKSIIHYNNNLSKFSNILQQDNVALIQARGMLFDAKNYGIISTLNIAKIVKEELVE